ncbi:hypothetical protein MKW94_014217 [Papaver nudicaule]|uniref:CREG-like beta-barrel domain-containing protein n=1 Tax=Papaver nudicaule TaxID=74823 RepID=A0AA41VKQ9_PAPNU|nr:hypothetical protein [Papaver nudicaule]
MDKLRVCLFCFAVVCLCSCIQFAEAGGPKKPNHKDGVATARWLVSQTTWGVLSTISVELGGAPFGNVASFSDGLAGEGHGIPYFYMTTLDPTPRNALKDARCSFSVNEFPLGSCGGKDPQNPTCAKLTLTGKLKLVDSNTTEATWAKDVLFVKHPEMKACLLIINWTFHGFQIFKLEIEDIFLINWFGGSQTITVAQYLQPRLWVQE